MTVRGSPRKMLPTHQKRLQNTIGVLRATRVLSRGDCSALGFLGTVFHDWVSILWGEGTPNDGMRERKNLKSTKLLTIGKENVAENKTK